MPDIWGTLPSQSRQTWFQKLTPISLLWPVLQKTIQKYCFFPLPQFLAFYRFFLLPIKLLLSSYSDFSSNLFPKMLMAKNRLPIKEDWHSTHSNLYLTSIMCKVSWVIWTGMKVLNKDTDVCMCVLMHAGTHTYTQSLSWKYSRS